MSIHAIKPDLYFEYAPGIIHVGAGRADEIDGFTVLNPSFMIWIEANPEQAKLAKINIGMRPNHYLVEALVYDKDNELIDFNIHNSLPSSSIFKDGPALKRIFPNISTIETIKLKTSTLDTIVESLMLPIQQINLLSMDIQGAEFLALKGATKILNNPDLKYIIIEVIKCDLYMDLPANKAEEYLIDFGFKPIKSYDDICFGQLVSQDILYTRK